MVFRAVKILEDGRDIERDIIAGFNGGMLIAESIQSILGIIVWKRLAIFWLALRLVSHGIHIDANGLNFQFAFFAALRFPRCPG